MAQQFRNGSSMEYQKVTNSQRIIVSFSKFTRLEPTISQPRKTGTKYKTKYYSPFIFMGSSGLSAAVYTIHRGRSRWSTKDSL